jgi:anti-anti-sigma regulatory factor
MHGRSPDESFDFCLSVRPLGPEVLVTLCGELDAASAAAVDAMFAEAVTATCRRVLIDASGVTFLDAARLGALLAGPAERGGEILVRAPPAGPLTASAP